MNKPAKTFGKKIKEARLALGVSRADLAERLNLNVSALSKIENDRSQTPKTTQIALEYALGLLGPNQSALTEDEKAMLDAFRKLPPPRRQELLDSIVIEIALLAESKGSEDHDHDYIARRARKIYESLAAAKGPQGFKKP